MSTILRALQKVERKQIDEVGQFSPTQPVNTTRTINQRLTLLWYLQLGKRYLIIGSGVLLLIVFTFFAFDMVKRDDAGELASKATDNPDARNLYPHKIPQPSNRSSSNEPDDVVQQRGPTRPPDYAPAPSSDPDHQPGRYASKYTNSQQQAKIAQTPKTQVEPPLETETVSPGLDEEPFDDEQELEIAPETALPTESVEPEAPMEVLESDPEELRYAQVDLLDDKSLELQAISYSTTPAQRIAVINNEIIHQNRRVGGYKVIYIGPEQVVVEKGGNQYKIIFMVR